MNNSSSAAARARQVEEHLAYQDRECVAMVLVEPSGAHKLQLGQVGSHYYLEMSLGEAIDARNVLERGIAELTAELGYERPIPRRFKRAVK